MGNQLVAFMDERHGLGAWVAEQIAADLFKNPARVRQGQAQAAGGAAASPDFSGREISSSDLGMSLRAGGMRRSFGNSAAAVASAPTVSPDAYKTWTSPRASAESTSAAVVSGQAQVGVLPLYDEYGGFNTETLSALMDFPQQVLGEYVAESNYVLAVPSDLIHEVDQAGFTDSFDANGGAGFRWTAEKQRKYSGRVGTVYASHDAMRHCSAAIEGMRARGIDVRLLPEGTDAYREGLAQAAQLLDPGREITTNFGPNGQSRSSKTNAGNHSKSLIGVLMAFDKALGNGGYSFDSDYMVLEAEMAGADRVRSSFIATTAVPKNSGLRLDPTAADMASLERFFGTSRRGAPSPEEGPLRHAPGLSDRADDAQAGSGAYPFARVLYALPTVGHGVRDHSPVLTKLAEAGLSYRTVSLERREGLPVVVAVDVPAGQQSKLKPISRMVHRLPGAERVATFPSVTPMVEESLRPLPESDPKMRLVMQVTGLIVLGLAAFVGAGLMGWI